MKRVLVTGGTGFLGAYLILELLRTTEHELLCLARGHRGQSGAARLHARLREVAGSLGLSDALSEAVERRVQVLDGQLTAPRLGLSDAVVAQLAIDEIWHCAALIQFLAARRKDVFEANVTGTQRVLELARELGAPPVNVVSTAYLAGERRGPVEEGPHDPAFAPNNCYEESKRVVETMLAEAGASWGLPYRVFRPSIIVGHSITLRPDSTSGVYGYLALVLALRRQLAASRPGYFERNPVRVLTEPGPRLNLICVDTAVDLMCRLAARDDTLGGTYHIVSPQDVSLSAYSQIVKEEVGVEFEFVTGMEAFTPIDYLVRRQVDRYNCYLVNLKDFAWEGTYALAGVPATRGTMDWEVLRGLTRSFFAENLAVRGSG